MKNLILGVAKGYSWDILEPFVTSYAKNCPDAELVLFVDKVSAFTRDKLISAGVTIAYIPAEYENILIIHTRWKMYADFLEAHGDDYERVFVSDTRDVIFQADLFASFKNFSNWLGYATEDDDIRGSKTGIDVNYRWLVGCFDKTEADKLANKKIICCGTVIASSREMKIFCRIMWNALKAETVFGYEQAMMNYLVYNELLPIENLVEIDVDDGEIFTMGMFMLQKPIATRGNFILHDKDFSVPAVVHQYERNDKLLAFADKIHRDQNFPFDERFTDPRSFMEQIRCLIYVDKVDDAARRFMNFINATTDFTEHVDELTKVWNAALQKDFLPSVEAIELVVQNALFAVGNEKFSADQLLAVKTAFVRAQKNRHAVYSEFKNSVVNWFRELARRALETKMADSYSFCMEQINELQGS